MNNPWGKQVTRNTIEQGQKSEVNDLLLNLQRIQSRNKAAHEHHAAKVKTHLDRAFESLLIQTEHALLLTTNDMAGTDMVLRQQVSSLRHNFSEITKVTKAAFQELSEETMELCHMETTVQRVTREHCNYLTTLQTELEEVKQLTESCWRAYENAQGDANRIGLRASEQAAKIAHLSWFKKIFVDVRSMRYQLEILRKAAKEKADNSHTAYQSYSNMWDLKHRESEIVAAMQSRIRTLKSTLVTVKIDENKLIDIKENVGDLLRNVTMLEVTILSDDMSFSRLDFLKCVLQLLSSEDMAQVEKSWAHIHTERQRIMDMCQARLSTVEWQEVQHPYNYQIDEI